MASLVQAMKGGVVIQLVTLYVVALTLAMEAAGEPYIGKLAVAWVIQNRRTKYSRSLLDVVMDPYDFSCWNTSSPTRANLDQITDAQFAECLKAALGACFGMEPDPTDGAVFYMNVAAVLKTNGMLPPWWDIDGLASSEIKIGNHTFRRHR